MPDGEPVLIADEVAWATEWRCFALDGRVLTTAPYRLGDWTYGAGSPPAARGETSATRFAEAILKTPPPGAPRAVVLDVGRLLAPGRPWAAVEANPVFAAHPYGCDPAAALEVLAAAWE